MFWHRALLLFRLVFALFDSLEVVVLALLDPHVDGIIFIYTLDVKYINLANLIPLWKFSAMVLSQEGYPSSGVQQVRDVIQKGEQWRYSGGPADTNPTRVIDLVWPQAGLQETWVSTYTPSQTTQTVLTVTNFARVEMLTKGQ